MQKARPDRRLLEGSFLLHVACAGQWGLIAGAVGGLINLALLGLLFRHVFTTPADVLRLGARLSFWYAIVCCAANGSLGAVVALLRRSGTFHDGTFSARGYRNSAGAALLTFWMGLVLNFAWLPRPVSVDALHIAANAMLLAAVVGPWGASLRRPQPDGPAWPPLLAVAGVVALLGTGAIYSARATAARGHIRTQVPAARKKSLPTRRAGRPVNLLLITVDTLRADHLGFYGYARDTSPFLDSLGEEGVIFDAAFAAKPITSPSFASIMTATYPSRHGIHNTSEVLTQNNLTLAEALQAVGYETAGVVTNGNLYPLYGFDQGFDQYLFGARDAAGQTEAVLSWLATRPKEPFFLWVHYIDPHSPYAPPAPYNLLHVRDTHYGKTPLPTQEPETLSDSGLGTGSPTGEQNTNLDWYLAQYDGEIRYTNDQIERVARNFERRGLLDHTLLVFAADHGESFGEQEYFGHGMIAHDSGSRIPLFLRWPGVLRARLHIREPVSEVDVMPTVLDLLGVGIPECVQGRSLASRMRKKTPGSSSGSVIVEAGFGEHIGPGNQQALRTNRWKYVWRDTSWIFNLSGPSDIFWMWNAMLEGGLAPDELYDLSKDPQETVNLARRLPRQAAKMKQQLLLTLARLGPPAPQARRIERQELHRVSPEVERSLQALGYIQ